MYYASIVYNDGSGTILQSRDKDKLVEIVSVYSFSMMNIKDIAIYKANGTKVGKILKGKYTDV